MNNQIKIRKAKLTKKGTLEVSYDEIITGARTSIINKLNKIDANKAHEDLITAFASLNPHMAIIAEQVRTQEKSNKIVAKDFIHKDDTIILDAIKVTGIAVGGDDLEGVTLIGTRKLKDGSILNIVSPFTKYHESPYAFAEELMQDVQVVISEVEEYLDGKHAPDTQLELELAAEAEFFDEAAELD
jgi:hypothetical protein